MDETTFLAEVDGLVARDRRLSPIEAAVLAAVGLGIAADSRAFAKIFGIAHALALRAIFDLEDAYGLIRTVSRDPRTQRTRLSLTQAGRALFAIDEERLAA